MPMSRTRPARSEKAPLSSGSRPNSLTSSAPATLNRSVIVVFISALRLHRLAGDAGESPPDPAGRQTNSGSSTSARR